MEVIIIISVILLLVVSLLLIPRSYSKGKGKGPQPYIVRKVYDVTPYVEEHPGGDAILKHAGGDSTEGFYGPQHASRVFDMVDEFYIGDLKS
ncbi:Cytochrome b5-like heme/steroid binding domain-containing protein [Dioscorea alata]|uniref:Cytochrome b5-like heme/steroid binding domain-containing protein n=1 Tax=Dioscorea alata TaxID=55571 RepID=A0ACB7TUM6_DIOAL|nr:Cytochrome b5-like heme/steroid binding domain-containing protein [Dioscorea alata]